MDKEVFSHPPTPNFSGTVITTSFDSILWKLPSAEVLAPALKRLLNGVEAPPLSGIPRCPLHVFTSASQVLMYAGIAESSGRYHAGMPTLKRGAAVKKPA